jgi:ribosomal protein L18
MDKNSRINYNIRSKNVRCLPILYVRFSNKHVRAQLVHEGKILFDVSSLNQKSIFDSDVKPYNRKGAVKLGAICGERIKQIGLSEYVLNRGDRKYEGVLKDFNDSVQGVVGGKSNE